MQSSVQTTGADTKFRILDSPTLLNSDLSREPGILGRAVIYLDIDEFKAINAKLTEVLVDELVLPPIHELLAKCVDRSGYAYAEGGDEFTVLLPNASAAMAVSFADALRLEIAAMQFEEAARNIHLTASFGVAHSLRAEEANDLKKNANVAKNHAKEHGKNCVALHGRSECTVIDANANVLRDTRHSSSAAKTLSEEEIRILSFLAQIDIDVPLNQVAAQLQVSPTKARYFLEELQEKNLIDMILNLAGEATYYLNKEGRRYLAAKGLLK